MDPISYTLTITFAALLSMQECHCDGVCGLGALGEQGPFQVYSLTQMKKLGCGDEVDWWSFDEAWPCVKKFLLWLDDTQECEQLEWTLAAYNFGIGNVLRLQRAEGCGLQALKDEVPHVYNFAKLKRARRCVDAGTVCFTGPNYGAFLDGLDRASRGVDNAAPRVVGSKGRQHIPH